MLGRLLIGAAVAWPLVAGAALWQRTSLNASGGVDAAGSGGVGARVSTAVAAPVWANVVYAVAGRICHQRPERSFHTHGVPWPVCARCTGLYLAAPFAAFIAFRRRSSVLSRLSPLRLVAIAAVPTALTLLWEWGGLGTPPNLVRFATALPLGAAVAFVLIETVTERQPVRSIG